MYKLKFKNQATNNFSLGNYENVPSMDEIISNTINKDIIEPEELEIILNSKYNSNDVCNFDLYSLENFRIGSFGDNLFNINKT